MIPLHGVEPLACGDAALRAERGAQVSLSEVSKLAQSLSRLALSLVAKHPPTTAARCAAVAGRAAPVLTNACSESPQRRRSTAQTNITLGVGYPQKAMQAVSSLHSRYGRTEQAISCHFGRIGKPQLKGVWTTNSLQYSSRTHAQSLQCAEWASILS